MKSAGVFFMTTKKPTQCVFPWYHSYSERERLLGDLLHNFLAHTKNVDYFILLFIYTYEVKYDQPSINTSSSRRSAVISWLRQSIININRARKTALDMINQQHQTRR